MSSAQIHFEGIANATVWKWLMRRALPMVDFDWHRAEDAVQQVFLRLWTKRDYDPTRGSPLSYAYRQLQNATFCLKDKELRSERKVATLRDIKPGFTSDRCMIEHREEAARVGKVIDRLAPPLRMAIGRHMRAETLQDVARKMGRSQKTVEAWETQAVDALRMALSE